MLQIITTNYSIATHVNDPNGWHVTDFDLWHYYYMHTNGTQHSIDIFVSKYVLVIMTRNTIKGGYFTLNINIVFYKSLY